MIFLFFLYFVGVLGEKYTLPGVCPDMKLQIKLDYTKFSGLWYHVGGYASDGGEIHDCATLDFQKDTTGYTLKETYVDGDEGNRTQLWYSVTLHTHYHPNDSAQFITSFKYEDQVLEHPLTVLATDYNTYAILYICQWLKNEKKHYVFTWILTRSKAKLQGETFLTVGDALSKFEELVEYKEGFVIKDFNDAICAYSKKLETDFFSSNIF